MDNSMAYPDDDPGRSPLHKSEHEFDRILQV
jgi:hypothetical protein